MKGLNFGMQQVLAAVLAVSFASTTMAQTADELAQSIQRNVEDIALQLRVAPAGAAEELERQKGQLESLQSQAPDHPMLSSLERRIEELESEVAAARAGQTEADEETEQFVPLRAPAEARSRLRDVEMLQNRADREMMRGAPESAAEYLSEADTMLEAIENEYGDQLPPGYAKLVVAKERSAALQDQLDALASD